MIPRSGVYLHDFTVVVNEPVARDIYMLVMRSPELARSLKPGQFMNVEVPGDRRHLFRIPLSFAHADGESGTVELVYAVVGEGTARLASMASGDTSTVLGPGGNGWTCPKGGRTLLVAGGVGAPPIVAAAQMGGEAGLPFDVVLGAQTKDKLWGESEARALGADEVLVTTDDGTYGIKGFTTNAMEELVSRHDYDTVMTCGPTPMMAGIARLAQEHGIACQASLEKLMGCGFGVCNCCNVAMVGGGYKSCCTDGPVFDASEVAW